MRWLIGCWEIEVGNTKRLDSGPPTSSQISSSIVIYLVCWCSQVKFCLKRSPVASSVCLKINELDKDLLSLTPGKLIFQRQLRLLPNCRGYHLVFLLKIPARKPHGSMRAAMFVITWYYPWETGFDSSLAVRIRMSWHLGQRWFAWGVGGAGYLNTTELFIILSWHLKHFFFK